MQYSATATFSRSHVTHLHRSGAAGRLCFGVPGILHCSGFVSHGSPLIRVLTSAAQLRAVHLWELTSLRGRRSACFEVRALHSRSRLPHNRSLRYIAQMSQNIKLRDLEDLSGEQAA